MSIIEPELSSYLRVKINDLILAHSPEEAERLIFRLLVVEKEKRDTRLVASQFLRRISKHDDAVRVLKTEIPLRFKSGQNELDVQTQLQLLRLLNLLGASKFATKIAAAYPLEIKKNTRRYLLRF